METGIVLSRLQEAYLTNDPSLRSLGRAASSVDPLHWALPRLSSIRLEVLEKELENPDLSPSERKAARLISENYGLVEALALGESDTESLNGAARDLAHLHSLKFAADLLCSDLLQTLGKCVNAGFVDSDGAVTAVKLQQFGDLHPKSRGIKFLQSVLQVRSELGLSGFRASDLASLSAADFYRPLQLSYLAERKYDSSISKFTGWAGAAVGAMFGGLTGALIAGAAAYLTWSKVARRLAFTKAMAQLNELECRGLKRYFDKSENSTELLFELN